MQQFWSLIDSAPVWMVVCFMAWPSVLAWVANSNERPGDAPRG